MSSSNESYVIFVQKLDSLVPNLNCTLVFNTTSAGESQSQALWAAGVIIAIGSAIVTNASQILMVGRGTECIWQLFGAKQITEYPILKAVNRRL